MKHLNRSVFPLITLAFVLGICLFFPSCDDSDLQDDLVEDFTTRYVFYSENPETTETPFPITITYPIGTKVAAGELPTVARRDFFELKPGYKIDSWVFYKNMLSGSKEIPGNISYHTITEDDETESDIVDSFTVTSIPVGFYVHEWLPISYYIVFDGNGGSYTDAGGTEVTKSSPVAFVYDTAAALPLNEFVRNGYIFNGWNTADNAGAQVHDYSDGETVKNLANVDGTVITLFACWLKEKITISFDANGGSGDMASQERISVDDSLSPCAFTPPEGKQFACWTFTSSDGSASYTYSDGEVLTENNYPNEDATLYAQWVWIPCTVTFDANGGGGTMEAQGFEWGQSQTLNANEFTLTGSDFTGWNTSADGSGTSYADGDAVSVKADTTLYAQWKKQTLTVTFDANGGTGSTASLSMSYGDTKSFPASGFTREGYDFLGWSVSDTAASVDYPDGYSVSTSNWMSGSLNLYAVWRIKTFTVTFDANGGSAVSAQTVDWGSLAVPAATTKFGYTFVGWYADFALTMAFDFATPVKQDYTLYAQWQVETRTVDFDLDGGTVGGSPSLASVTISFEDLPYTPAMTPSKDGYNFSGWSPALTESNWSTDNVTLKAQWIPIGAASNTSDGLTVKYTGEGIVVTAPMTGESYLWMVDKTKQSETSDTYTILYADYAGDTSRHTLSVLVFDAEGMPSLYSTQFQIQ